MDKLWYFLNIALDVYPFMFLQYLPFRDKLKVSYAKTMTICSVVMLLQFFGFVWLTGQPFYTQDIMLLYRISSLIILLILNVIFVRDNFVRVCFVFGLMTPYVMATIATASYFSYIIRSPESPVYMLTSLFRMALISISFPIIYFLVKKYLLPAMKIGDEKMWRYALPVPLMFSLICLFFVDPQYEFIGVSPKALFGMLFIFFGCIFTCYFLLKALHQVQEKTELAEHEKQSRQMLSMQQDQYKLIADNIESARTARHDLRHFISAASRFIDSKQYDKLAEYVSSFIEPLTQDTELVICDNYAVNSIAGYYIRLAKAKGIDVSFAFAVKETISVSDIDLCVIIGNTMENAIEACAHMVEGKRFIHMYAKVIGSNISFICDNSFDGVVQMDGEEYLSRKRGATEKGIGLSSIAAVVKKYDGQMQVEHNADTFMLSVLLTV